MDRERNFLRPESIRFAKKFVDSLSASVNGRVIQPKDMLCAFADALLILKYTDKITDKLEMVSPDLKSEVMKHPDFDFYPIDRRIVRRDGEAIPLSPQERNLLLYFMVFPNKVFSVEVLRKNMGQTLMSEEPKAIIRTYIYYLRNKIKDQRVSKRDGQWRYISTVRDVGYFFTPFEVAETE